MDFLRRVVIGLTVLIVTWILNVSTTLGQCNNIDFQASKTKSCVGQITFKATGIPNNSSLYWDFGEGEIPKNDTFIKEFFSSKGFYDVHLRVVLPNGNECNIQKFDYIQVGVNPNADFQVSDTLLCNGSGSVTFTDSSKAIKKRDWVIGGQQYSADSQITRNFSSTGYIDAILITEDSLGCNYYLKKDSAVYISPQVGVNFSTNDTTSGCSPLNNIQITPSLNQGGQTLTQYKWYFPGSDVDSATDPNNPVPPALSYGSSGTYDVTFQVETSLNCTYSTTKSGFIQVGDSIGVDFSSNTTNICSGGTVTLANESDTLEANATGSFNWSLDGGNVVSSSSDTQKVKYNSTGSKSISLNYSGNSCTNSETKNDFISIKGVTADFTADSIRNCQPPLTTYFTDTSSSNSAGSITSYEWTFFDKTGENVLDTSTNQNDSFTYNSTNGFGSYDVKLKVTHSNGCSDSITKSGVVTIEEPQVQFNAQRSVVCPKDTVKFSNETEAYSTIEDNEKFDWYVYDGGLNLIDSAKNPSEFGYRVHDSLGNYSFKLITYDGKGCNDTLFDSNTVKVKEPDINYTIGQKQACSGVSIKFTASDSSNLPLDYTFDFSNKDTLFSKNGEVVNTKFPAPGAYNVKLTGNADTFCVDSLSKTDSVKINSLGGDFVIDSTKGCSPLKTTVKPSNFQISNVNNNDSIQYTWSGSSGVTFSNKTGTKDTSNIESIASDVTVTGKGDFTITLNANNLEGCSQTISKNNFISLGTNANFNMPSNACLKDTVQLSNQSPVDDNSKWSTDNPNNLEFQPFDIATNPEISFSDTGTYKVTLASKSPLGCNDTITKSITVKKVTVDFSSEDTFYTCAPQVIDFQGTADNATQFTWQFGDNTGTKNTPSPSTNHLYEKNTGGTGQDGFDVTLIGSNDITGCSDTLVRDNYIQIIGPAPEFTMNNNKGCGPQTVTFSDSSSNVETFYFDYGRGLPIDSNEINPYTYQTKLDKAYASFKPSMYAYGPSGCPPRTFEPKDSIVAYKIPRAQFNADPNKACNPVEVQFSDSTTFGADYQWDLQNDGTFDDTVKNPNYTYNQPGDYSVFMRVTTKFGCQDSMLQTDTITSYPVPEADFETPDTFLCYGEELNLSNLTTSDTSITDYHWNFGDNGATDDTSDQEKPAPYSYQAKGPATVSLIIEDVNACKDTMEKENYILVDRETLPPTTEVNYVSVEDSNRINLNWQQNPNNDFFKYFINRKEPSTTFSRYDSVQNQIDTSYFDVLSNQSANSGPLCYTVETSDVCRNISNPGQEHCSIHLTISNPATAQNLLNWKPYVGWTAVDRYSIYRKTEDSTFSLLTEVPGDSTQYLDEPVCNERYCYYIIAHHPSEDFTSKSNQACQEPPYELQEQPLDLKYTTVFNDSFTYTSWEPGTQSNIDEYIIDRYQKENGWQQEYATTESTQLRDLQAMVNRSSYQYRVAVKDQCGNVSDPSNVGSSIYLQSINKEDAVELKWTPYENWKSGIQNYTIQALKQNGQFEDIATVPSEDSAYIDDKLKFETGDGYCYRVVAKQKGLQNDSSVSNTSCTIIPSRIFIPSGFSPNGNGLNETFGVVAESVRNQANDDELEFTFKVFNRWGQIVFQTNDLDEKWDGAIDGEPAPTGTYHYFLEAYGKDQKKFFIEGKVKLIR